MPPNIIYNTIFACCSEEGKRTEGRCQDKRTSGQSKEQPTVTNCSEKGAILVEVTEEKRKEGGAFVDNTSSRVEGAFVDDVWSRVEKAEGRRSFR